MSDEIQVATNGETLSLDDSGRLVDHAGNYGYSAHFTGAYVCYTCGHMCECADNKAVCYCPLGEWCYSDHD